MFETLIARVERTATRRAEARTRRLAERLAGALPKGVAVAAVAEGVALEGSRLRRRLALDPALKWMLAGMIR